MSLTRFAADHARYFEHVSAARTVVFFFTGSV
jgi:hypothetical protein